MPATLPETFGRYRIVKKLGEGGMGAVYLAEDSRMRRKVALKVPHFRDDEDPRVIERFYREARLAGQITHPNLCPVHDVDCVGGVHFLTMAYVEGTPLDHYVGSERPWPPEQAVALVRHLASVLGLLHAQGIIHRDLKPGNVMMRPDGSPVLMDFGLARSFDASSQQLTTQGKALGTPAFMAPEQVNGDEKAIGPQTDVWALGVMLYQLLTGQLPFTGRTPMEVCSRVLFMQVPPPSSFRPGFHPRLDAVCAQVLAKDPRQRPATMAAFDTLLAARDAPPPQPPAIPARDEHPTYPSQWAPTLTPPASTPPGRARLFRRLGLIAVALAGLAACVGLLLAGLGAFGPAQQAQQSTAPTPAARLQLALPAEVSVTAGATETVEVRVQRTNCQGEVKLFQGGEAGGVTLVLNTIEAGKNQTSIRIEAGPGAVGKHKVSIVARGPGMVETVESMTVHVKPAAAVDKAVTNCIGMSFVLIPKGRFQMGSPGGEAGRDADEGQHEVEISKPFYLGVYEVTQGEYEQVMKTNPSKFRKDGEYAKDVEGFKDTKRFPVENVSHDDAVKFCVELTRLSKERGENCSYRLPTEAEWEHSCRGGAPAPQVFHYGDRLSSREANFNGDYPYGGAARGNYLRRPVAVDDPNYKPNGFGLYHMLGNVREWCADWYGDYPAEAVSDPRGPQMGPQRVYRGGSWYDGARGCRSASRYGNAPHYCDHDLGLRLVRVPSGQDR